MRIEVGARIQRGRVISVATDGVIVQSEETGVPTLPIKNLLPSDPAVESRVLFIEFDDGEGAVIALL